MKVLIAGTGSIGKRHIRNIQMLDKYVEFVFLRYGARQDALSTALNAHVVSNISEIESLAVDWAVVATPSALHTQLIVDLIEMSVPMYIEKPVVTFEKDVALVRDVLGKRQYQQTTLVGCNLRFLPSLIKLKTMLDTGVIGDVVRATFQVGQWLPDWRPGQDYTQSYSAKPELGGGVIMDLIHEFDAARWLFGDFDSVHAFVSSCPTLNIQSEAVASIIMKGRNTPLVSINLDYVARNPIRCYEFIGNQGTIVWDLIRKKLILYSPDENIVNIRNEYFDFDVGETYKVAMRTFVNAVQAVEILEQDIYEGLKSVELALKVKEVAKQ